MAVSKQVSKASSVDAWFERRSYDHAQFADLDRLTRRKRELGVSVSAVLPAREVAATVGAIVDAIRSLLDLAPLVDQLLVIDADSSDGSAEVAARHGAEVYLESELMPGYGPTIGKGDAMWRALSVTRGDVVVYLDSDTTDFGRHFVYGVLGPLLSFSELRFVKAAYNRPWRDTVGVELANGGRVTELTARPLFNLFYPELTGFAQPLAGEIAASRELLCSIPFFTGYAVETGMMIDVLRAVGLDAMAQVDLGTRTNRNQALFDLSRMSYEVLRAVEHRLREERRLGGPVGSELDPELDGYVHAIRSSTSLSLDRRSVEFLERPPMADVAESAMPSLRAGRD
jgi:glucosyl-3-phosphoglycerate synthase